MTTVAIAVALPHAADVARAQEAMEAAGDRVELMVARADLQWARIDMARSLAGDPAARALAAELAAEGDEDAADALALADEIGPGPPKREDAPSANGCDFPPGVIPGRLREMLEGARRDEQSFAVAWSQAMRALRIESGLWAWVLSSTRPAWRAAYNREDAPRGLRVMGWPDD